MISTLRTAAAATLLAATGWLVAATPAGATGGDTVYSSIAHPSADYLVDQGAQRAATVYDHWGTPEQQAIRNATPDVLAGGDYAAGSMGPKVRAACWFAERTGNFAAIGAIDDTQALLTGEAGTRVEVQTAIPTG